MNQYANGLTKKGQKTTAQADGEAFKPFLKAVGRGEKLRRDLTYEESVEALRLILNGTATEAQIGAFLISQRVKGEAVDEIRGCTDVVRAEFMHPITPNVEGLLDLGVPYDGKAKTAQLAPAIAFVLSAVGIPVALHGDEDVPTKQGISPGLVLQALGVDPHLPVTAVQKMIESAGFGYLSAAQFAPAWHRINRIRRQFGLRTVMNTVEKFFNPTNAPYQVTGFFHANYIERIRSTQTGMQASWMVQGEEGSIEMAVGRKTKIFATDAANDVTLEPADVGFPQRERIELPPIVDQHAILNTAVLAGEAHPASDQTAFTAGTIFYLLGAATDIADGLAQAQKALASGAAMRKLEMTRRVNV